MHNLLIRCISYRVAFKAVVTFPALLIRRFLIGCIAFGRSINRTQSAYSMLSTIFGGILVVSAFLILMPIFAMGKAAIMIDDVLLMRNVSQVVRVNATLVQTDMVKFMSFGNGVTEYLERNNMGFDVNTINHDARISSFGQTGSPVPTSRYGIEFKLFDEAINEGSVYRHNKKSTRTQDVMRADDIAHPRCRLKSDLPSLWRITAMSDCFRIVDERQEKYA